jgi:hypothetical protein
MTTRSPTWPLSKYLMAVNRCPPRSIRHWTSSHGHSRLIETSRGTNDYGTARDGLQRAHGNPEPPERGNCGDGQCPSRHRQSPGPPRAARPNGVVQGRGAVPSRPSPSSRGPQEQTPHMQEVPAGQIVAQPPQWLGS